MTLQARRPTTATVLSVIVLFLALIACLGDLFLPGLLRGNEWTLNAIRGQDLYTLVVALPALAVTLIPFWRGSHRAALVLTGILGYIFYTYVGGSFAFIFNEFFLIYVALFALSAAAMVAVVNSLDLASLPVRFGPGTPRRAVAVFLISIGLMLALVEIGQIIPFITDGTLPLAMELSGGSTFFVYAMDLGVIAPLTILAGVWLWQRRPWGYLLSGMMLIKAATMGLALVAANLYTYLVGGTPDSIGLNIGYAFIGLGGLAFAIWLFRHCRL